MFTPWSCIDSDCCQYIRNDGNKYEMIQAVWLDTTEEDREKGFHEYCVVRIEIDLNDYSDEERSCYISSYGYTLENIVEEYGDGADSILEQLLIQRFFVQHDVRLDGAAAGTPGNALTV